MIDLSNKFDDKLETKKLNNLEETLDNAINKKTINNNNIDTLSHDTQNNTTSVDNQELNNTENGDSEVANCLALTIKKDYSLSIAKNVALKTWKNFWRIAVSVFTLNFLKFFL